MPEVLSVTECAFRALRALEEVGIDVAEDESGVVVIEEPGQHDDEDLMGSVRITLPMGDYGNGVRYDLAGWAVDLVVQLAENYHEVEWLVYAYRPGKIVSDDWAATVTTEAITEAIERIEAATGLQVPYLP